MIWLWNQHPLRSTNALVVKHSSLVRYTACFVGRCMNNHAVPFAGLPYLVGMEYHTQKDSSGKKPLLHMYALAALELSRQVFFCLYTFTAIQNVRTEMLSLLEHRNLLTRNSDIFRRLVGYKVRIRSPLVHSWS
jgi:hypothetical protein